MSSVDCLGRIPYASVIAFIMVLCGAGIMCGTLYEAINITKNYFGHNFYPIDELRLVQVGGILCAVVVVALAIILLVFGVLTTGATRARIYRGDKCIMGGRVSAGIFLALTYIVNLCWLGISAVLVTPVIMWLMLSKVCYEEITYYDSLKIDKDSEPFKYKFNITTYGLYKKVYLYPKTPRYRETIQNFSSFSSFCTEISNVGPLFACALGGALFVILGLVTFISALSANYMRLKYTKELTDYRLTAEQSTELDYLPTAKSA